MGLSQKSELMNWLLLPRNKHVLKVIEDLRAKELIQNYERSLKPLTEKQLIDRALKAEAAIKAGNVLNQEDFEQASSNW